MKVRVTNKHLIIAVVVFLACTGLVYASGPSICSTGRNGQGIIRTTSQPLRTMMPDRQIPGS